MATLPLITTQQPPIPDSAGSSPGSSSGVGFDDDILDFRPRRSVSFLSRLLRTVIGINPRRKYGDFTYDFHALPNDEDSDAMFNEKPRHTAARGYQRRPARRLLKRLMLGLPLLILMLFGLLHIGLVVLGRVPLFLGLDQYEPDLPAWGQSMHNGANLPGRLVDVTRDVLPIPCHSHNDYWRKLPLFDALHWGCTSVEADVWHFDADDSLYVGHNRLSLTHGRTFTSLYVDPLVDLLDSLNNETDFSNDLSRGVYLEEPEQTLVLLVDFKTDGYDLYPYVYKQLEALRQKDYLSHWDGDNFVSRAVTVVGTGNVPFDLISEQLDRRDIFFDAPLDELWEKPAHPSATEDPSDDLGSSTPSRSSVRKTRRGQGRTGTHLISSPTAFNTSNSYYASVSFWQTIGYPWTGSLSTKQLELIRGQIQGAQQRGLKARYWDTPSWPTSLRNHVWEILIQEGADVLNVDDLEAAATLDWNKAPRHDWFDAR